MGVEPKNRGILILPPKWMVKIMENRNPIKMDNLGGPPLFLETRIYILRELLQVENDLKMNNCV